MASADTVTCLGLTSHAAGFGESILYGRMLYAGVRYSLPMIGRVIHSFWGRGWGVTAFPTVSVGYWSIICIINYDNDSYYELCAHPRQWPGQLEIETVVLTGRIWRNCEHPPPPTTSNRTEVNSCIRFICN